MARFLVLNGNEHVFGTDDERSLRQFLAFSGTNNPTLSMDVRGRLTALLQLLPVELPVQETIEEQTGKFHERLKIIIGKKSWQGPGS